ncbi:hypothetical protein HQ487_05445 [Candidatus Uhrbacteria bacterium]|nr:hypothetical protein [Candidatus Uhrbacteria bacterium]
MKRLAFLIVLLTLTILPGTAFAYSSGICTGSSTCSAQEVGVFMEGISKACGNTGDCTLEDIMLLFVNTGNYVAGIIGGIVLLMYVVGGFYFLASAGRTEWVAKGKKYLTISTTGLLIVMFAYIGIITLSGVLKGNNLTNLDLEGYVACSGTETLNLPCDLNSTCTNGGYTCESMCRQSYPDAVSSTDGGFSTLQYFDCVDSNTYPASSADGNPYRSGSCIKDLCPGGTDYQCCQLEYFYL